MRRAAGALAAVAGLVVASSPAGAQKDPLDQARDAARLVPFSARVSVRWLDRGRDRTARLAVEAANGLVRIDGPAPVVAGGSERLVFHNQGWTLVWPGGLYPEASPGVDRKYEVRREPGPLVAERATTLVSLWRRAGGQLRERLAIDQATGLALQREIFDDRGRPVRVVRVDRLDLTARPPLEHPEPQRVQQAGLLVRAAAVTPPYPAPLHLAGGYRRVGAYQRARLVHLLYSDGLHGLSLFTGRGTLANGDPPSGGQPVAVGRARGVRFTWPGGEVVTWKAGGAVNTLVGDSSFDEVLAAARSLPAPRPLPPLALLRYASRRLAEVVTGGR